MCKDLLLGVKLLCEFVMDLLVFGVVVISAVFAGVISIVICTLVFVIFVVGKFIVEGCGVVIDCVVVVFLVGIILLFGL